MPVQDDATKQLGSIPFSHIIGGPLVAAVEAQAKAAKSTVDFIESVGFKKPEDGISGSTEIQTVDFTYESGGKTVEITVPLLAIVPIPYIRIEDMTLQFKANISAETSTKNVEATSSTKKFDAKVSGRYGWGPGRVRASFSAAYSAKKDSKSAADSKYAIEYTMDVNVHAVQDDIPAGMQKVLNLLNDSIKGPADKETTTPTS